MAWGDYVREQRKREPKQNANSEIIVSVIVFFIFTLVVIKIYPTKNNTEQTEKAERQTIAKPPIAKQAEPEAEKPPYELQVPRIEEDENQDFQEIPYHKTQSTRKNDTLPHALINLKKPKYPKYALMRGIGGYVTYQVYYEKGNFQYAKMAKTSGYTELDNAALEAISRTGEVTHAILEESMVTITCGFEPQYALTKCYYR